MIRKALLTLAAVLLAGVVYAQTTTFPPPAGTIVGLCTYQSATQTYTSGRPGFLQCDVNGNLKVTPTGSSGGGGAVTIADGADVAEGAIANAACASDASNSCTVISMLKRIAQNLTTIATNVASSIPAGAAAIGDVGLYPRVSNMTVTPVSFSAAGNNIVVLRATGTIKLYKLVLSCASSSNLTLMNGTTVSASGIMPSTSIFLPFDTQPHVTTTSTNNLVINQPTAIACGGFASYLDN